jgi:cytochrome c biogenesis protein CcmG/thiol:disulfide interchange protein DsbE
MKRGGGNKKTAAAADGSRDPGALRRLGPAAITALAMAFVAIRFVSGARDTLARTRDGACVALEPAALPQVVQSGAPPDFQLPDAAGRSVSLSQQRGHPVLLNFWATWCPPCVDEVPSLEDLARRLKGTDMRMLAVSVDDDWDKIRRFFPKGSDIGVLLDTSHNVPKTFGTEMFPETFLIDAAGRIRYYFNNKRDWSRPEAVACLESLR